MRRRDAIRRLLANAIVHIGSFMARRHSTTPDGGIALRRFALILCSLVVLTVIGGSYAVAGSSPTSRRNSALTTVPTGAHLVASIPIPTNGPITVGGGSVWVIDRHAADIADPAAASLLRIDPATDTVVSRWRGIVGPAMTVAHHAIWVASPAINRVLRVSMDGTQRTEIRTGPSADEFPYAIASAAGAIWVGNHHGWTVVRIDPRTNRVVGRIPVGGRDGGGPIDLTSDGRTLWLMTSKARPVLQIDAATSRIVSRTDVSPTGTCGGIAAGGGFAWITSGFDPAYSCWRRKHQGIARIDIRTHTVERISVGARPDDVTIAFGSVWVLTAQPDTTLVRIDPATGGVIGRLPLPGASGASIYGSNRISAGFGSIWVRMNSFPGDGAVLRIAPD